MKDEPEIPDWAVELAAAFKDAERPSDAVSANAIGELIDVDGRRVKAILEEMVESGTMERFDVGTKLKKSFYKPVRGVTMKDVVNEVRERVGRGRATGPAKKKAAKRSG